MSAILKFTVLSCMMGLFTHEVIGQDLSRDELVQQLSLQDSLLFEQGFNQCDMALIKTLLASDFEFYHDRDGVIDSPEAFIKTLQVNRCSAGSSAVRRVLQPESLVVHPLYAEGVLYGAIQSGNHYFGETSAQFVHLWLWQEQGWLLSRVMSFAHEQIGIELPAGITLITLTEQELRGYAGDYAFSPDFTLSVIYEGGKLYGDAEGQKAEIMPYGAHQFLDESMTMQLQFIVGADGVVTGLQMTGPDGEMHSKRLD